MNGAKIRRAWDGLLPRRGCRVQPGVSTPGTYHPQRRALKGRKIEQGNALRPFRANRFIGCYPGLKPMGAKLSGSRRSVSALHLFKAVQTEMVRLHFDASASFESLKLALMGLKPRAEPCGPFGAKNYPKNTVILAPLAVTDQL
jgi:hypothetical protein